MSLLKVDHSLIRRNQMRQEQLLAEKAKQEEEKEQSSMNKYAVDMAVLTEKVNNFTKQISEKNDTIGTIETRIKTLEDSLLKLSNKITESDSYIKTLNNQILTDKDLLGKANSEIVKYKTLYETESQARLRIEIQLDEEKANRLTQKPEPQMITQVLPIQQEIPKQTGWNVEAKRDGAGNILRYVLTPEG